MSAAGSRSNLSRSGLAPQAADCAASFHFILQQFPLSCLLVFLLSGTACTSTGPNGERPGDRATFAGIEFVWVPGGCFLMGSGTNEEGHYANESPQHRVLLTHGFWMTTCEVTKGMWEPVMNTAPWRRDPPFPNVTDTPDSPAVHVTWRDAEAFVDVLNQQYPGNGFCLPTEAQWERACRADTTSAYYFGTSQSQLSEYEWWEGDTFADLHAHEVGLKAPNPWGLHDMLGNVHEWCQDWSAEYPSGPRIDPAGPSDGINKVARGGAWNSDARACRSAVRLALPPNSVVGHDLGFRIVRPE